MKPEAYRVREHDAGPVENENTPPMLPTNGVTLWAAFLPRKAFKVSGGSVSHFGCGSSTSH